MSAGSAGPWPAAMAIIGASRIETTRMVTAASELARND